MRFLEEDERDEVERYAGHQLVKIIVEKEAESTGAEYSITVTSVPSERLFSSTGNLVSNKRSCLLPENVDKLLFLYENL